MLSARHKLLLQHPSPDGFGWCTIRCKRPPIRYYEAIGPETKSHPSGGTTFSLLPDCLAARLPGTLAELEEVVAEAEQARSLMAVADQLRSDAVELAGAMRWVRRRVLLVQHVLRLVIGLLPQQLSGCRAEITACRKRPGSEAVLVSLRSLTGPWLPAVAAPLGFRPHGIGREHPTGRIQHNLGLILR